MTTNKLDLEKRELTAPQLLAVGKGVDLSEGDHRCFYCGARCGSCYTAKEYVKKTFTARDTVCGGEHVCEGCVIALNQNATVFFFDGATKSNQKTQFYSWVITSQDVVAASKAHRDYLFGTCIAPPAPPYSIVISNSGKKHILYLGKVCYSRDIATVLLETETITYRTSDLRCRVQLCKKIAAVVGKPSLSERINISQLTKIIEYHNDESLIDRLLSAREEPLTRLAIWLTPGKKECGNEYPNATAAR